MSAEVVEGRGVSAEVVEGRGVSAEVVEGRGVSAEVVEGRGVSAEVVEGRGCLHPLWSMQPYSPYTSLRDTVLSADSTKHHLLLAPVRRPRGCGCSLLLS